MLEVAGLSLSYGKHRALSDIGLKVGLGEIVTILGANGAGKTTLLKSIAGLIRPAAGSITLVGHDLLVLKPYEIVEASIALVPEGRGLFGDLTVRENLRLGAYANRARVHEAENLTLILQLFPRLQERLDQYVNTMSGGEQQMVAIGRALNSAPDILLLDEPSLGLSPLLCSELFQTLARVRETGVGILLVEQNVKQSLKIADRGYLIETGKIVGEGTSTQLANDPAVQRAYLGAGEVRTRLASANQTNKVQPTEAPLRAIPPGRANTDRVESVMKHVNLIIGERDAQAADGRTFDRLDPMTGEVASRAAAATVADAIAAADAAAAAFPAWSATGPSERRMKLLAAADKLEARDKEFAETMLVETGGTGPWAHFNVHLAAGMLREAASMTTQIAGETIPADKPNSFAMSIRQPVGVVLGIAPWNAPVILGVRAIAMPLACGNTVVLKASEICPATHRLIGTVLREAGLPAGVVNVVTHAPADASKVVETLIAHQAVRRINFTGSTKVGRLIAEMAARYLKPVLLELGGKAPLVILDDADLDEAVKAAAFGAFANQGQICMSTERIIVDAKIADDFAARLAKRVAALPVGDPTGPVVLGSLVDLEAVEHVQRLVADAVSHGAKVLTGATAQGTIMQGTVVDGVTAQMALFREESFGPQVSITRASSDEDAVRLANDTEYGLSAAVFSRDIARALHVARQIQSGICHINGPTVHDEAQMPFGGTKGSGYGRFGGKAAIDEFTELRWITIQSGTRHYPF